MAVEVERSPRTSPAEVLDKARAAGVKVVDIHRHRSARLAHIKHKQRTLCMAGRSHTSGIQQRTVVKAHMTHGDNARSRRHGRN